MHQRLLAEKADPEDADEYRTKNVFWVPKKARWAYLQGKAKQPNIGKLVDDAMVTIERDNPRLKGILPIVCRTNALVILGQMVLRVIYVPLGLDYAENRSKD